MGEASKKIIARPYARAAFEYAAVKGELDIWHEFLVQVAQFIKQPQVLAWIYDPRISPQHLIKRVTTLCEQWVTDAQKNFLYLLIEKKRLIELPEIAELYAEYRYEREKTIAVNVLSYSPLQEKQRAVLSSKLEKRFERKVTLQCEVDDSLLGGAIIYADDYVIDGSVRNKLLRLKRAIELD